MAVFPAVRETEAGGVAEPCGGSVNDLGKERKRLQGTGAEFLQQKKRGEISEVTLVSESEHSPEALQIDVFDSDIVMRGHHQALDMGQVRVWIVMRRLKDGLLRGASLAVNEIHDLPQVFTDNASVRLGNKIANSCRMPMIATRHSGGIVHSLLHDSPFPVAGENEGMKVKLKTVGHSIVVDAGGEAAGSDKCFTVSAGHRRDTTEFVGGSTGLPSASAADVNSEFVTSIGQASLQSAHHRGGDPGGVPVHSHYGAERLEPEGITEARKKFRRAIVIEDGFDNRGAKGGHSLGEPRRYASTVQGQIGGAGAFHWFHFNA